jgi:hypothetical protein
VPAPHARCVGRERAINLIKVTKNPSDKICFQWLSTDNFLKNFVTSAWDHFTADLSGKILFGDS